MLCSTLGRQRSRKSGAGEDRSADGSRELHGGRKGKASGGPIVRSETDLLVEYRSVGGIPIKGESGIASFYAQGLGPCLPIISKVWRVVGRCGRLASLTTCDGGVWALRTDSEFILQRITEEVRPHMIWIYV